MSKIAIMTDSNSGMAPEEAKALGVHMIPMPFYIDDELFFEGVSLSQEEFYEKLENDHEIHTSQPSPADLLFLWDECLKEYDSVVYIPMSSGLSSSCETARMLALDYNGKIEVVNNQRVSVTQRQSVLDALELGKAGKTAEEIREILERERMESSIYITVDTLQYLKKGGRITPTAAAIGTVLGLKPVLQINGEKLDAYAKVRGKKAAKETMLNAMKKDFEEKYKGVPKEKIHLAAAYSGNPEEAAEWKAEVEQNFPGMEVHLAPLSLSVSCHIGKGSLAIACSKAIEY
ncbi:MAG: DegV family protein [Ruminococcus sp.]|nr:DegV family protein [Ruminococcus sp.]